MSTIIVVFAIVLLIGSVFVGTMLSLRILSRLDDLSAVLNGILDTSTSVISNVRDISDRLDDVYDKIESADNADTEEDRWLGLPEVANPLPTTDTLVEGPEIAVQEQGPAVEEAVEKKSTETEPDKHTGKKVLKKVQKGAAASELILVDEDFNFQRPRKSRRSPGVLEQELTANRDKLVRMLLDGSSMEDVCTRFKVTRAQMLVALRDMGLPTPTAIKRDQDRYSGESGKGGARTEKDLLALAKDTSRSGTWSDVYDQNRQRIEDMLLEGRRCADIVAEVGGTLSALYSYLERRGLPMPRSVRKLR